MNTDPSTSIPAVRFNIRHTIATAAGHEYFLPGLIILISTVLNFLLVFLFSDYQTYLTSDMHGYWERALQIFNGDEKTPNTWVSNAPFYSRVIADIFTWLNFLGLNEYRLVTMLSLNILASALGTLALYHIGMHVTGHRLTSLLLAGAYAFSYPNLYFNTFLLGEPIAVPLIITSIWLLFRYCGSYKVVYAGLLLAFAVGIRPSNGLLGLPFALYILFAGLKLREIPFKKWFLLLFPRAVRAGIFSLAFFAVIFAIVAENFRISDGKLRGITAHSGYNFFLGQTQSHMIVSRFDGLQYGFVPSSVAGNPEYGTIEVDIPIYDSPRFMEEGFKMLERHPELWLEHLAKFNFLFFDNLFPAVPSVLGFDLLFDPFRYIIFSMLLLSGLIFIPVREKNVRVADVAFFSAIFVLCSMSLYLFTVTHQYFLNFSYTVYVLFFMMAFGVVRNFRKYRRSILIYLCLLTGLLLLFQGLKYAQKVTVEETIAVTVSPDRHRLFRLNQPRMTDEAATESFAVNTLNFVAREQLTHEVLGDFGFRENFFLDAVTEMQVHERGEYMFSVYADDGYQLSIDDRAIMGYNGLKKMHEFETREVVNLDPGTYTLKVSMFQSGVLSGLVGYYRRIDNEEPVAPWYYNSRKGHGYLIGENSDDITFSQPEQ